MGRENRLMMHDGRMMDGWGMMGPWMWFFMILFWALVLFGLVWTIRWLADRNKQRGEKRNAESPMDVLKKRYAKGEISQEEFERMKRNLE
jgi:putative membrane protein